MSLQVALNMSAPYIVVVISVLQCLISRIESSLIVCEVLDETGSSLWGAFAEHNQDP